MASIDTGHGPIYIGVGYGLIAPSTEPKPVANDREYVASTRGMITGSSRQALSQSIDSLTRMFGWQVYDAMLCDPIAGGAFDILRLGVLAEEMQLSPTVVADEDADPEAEPTPEVARAKEIAEYCERLVAGLPGGFERFLWEALECLAYGNKLAEKVYKLQDVGPDKGRLVWDRLKFKPRWTWLFVTDGRLNQLGIMAWTADQAGVIVIPRDKFAVFTWGDRDGDPRGSSVLRAAYDAWNQKVTEIIPEWERFRRRFGQPVPIGKTAPGEQDRPPTDPATGVRIPGMKPVSPQKILSDALAAWEEGEALAVPAGTEIELCEPKTEGEVFHIALDVMNREMTHAILKNSRTTLEAEHGSKADSETGENVTGLVIRLIRRMLGRTIRDELLSPAVELSFGKEDAHAYTPHPSFGQTEHQDFATDATAAAQLQKSGFIDPSQKRGISKKLGLPASTDPPEKRGGRARPGRRPRGRPHPGEVAEAEEEGTRPMIRALIAAALAEPWMIERPMLAQIERIVARDRSPARAGPRARARSRRDEGRPPDGRHPQGPVARLDRHHPRPRPDHPPRDDVLRYVRGHVRRGAGRRPPGRRRLPGLHRDHPRMRHARRPGHRHRRAGPDDPRPVGPEADPRLRRRLGVLGRLLPGRRLHVGLSPPRWAAPARSASSCRCPPKDRRPGADCEFVSSDSPMKNPDPASRRRHGRLPGRRRRAGRRLHRRRGQIPGRLRGQGTVRLRQGAGPRSAPPPSRAAWPTASGATNRSTAELSGRKPAPTPGQSHPRATSPSAGDASMPSMWKRMWAKLDAAGTPEQLADEMPEDAVEATPEPAVATSATPAVDPALAKALARIAELEAAATGSPAAKTVEQLIADAAASFADGLVASNRAVPAERDGPLRRLLDGRLGRRRPAPSRPGRRGSTA